MAAVRTKYVSRYIFDIYDVDFEAVVKSLQQATGDIMISEGGTGSRRRNPGRLGVTSCMSACQREMDWWHSEKVV